MTDYQRLLFLDALEAAGVDNWGGYDEARRIYKVWLKEDEDEKNLALKEDTKDVSERSLFNKE